MSGATYYVDEAGDGVLFGPRGRNRLDDENAPRYFMLGMVRCQCDDDISAELESLRKEVLANPLYSSIPSAQPEAKKTARMFHAKDDHAEIRAKVFEILTEMDFKFYAVIKDMRKVLNYVQSRNQMDSHYRYKPNDLYDLTVRMLFKHRLHQDDEYRIIFARRGKSDRTATLKAELERTRNRFLESKESVCDAPLEIVPAYPHEQVCLQVTDYCLWALQRCYERGEARFLHALWDKVSLIHDVDDPDGKKYGTYLTRKSSPPDPKNIKVRRI